MPTEVHEKPTLVTSREPVAATESGSPKSIGGLAFNDSVMIILIAWAVIAVLVFSLRPHNV